jgi:tetratricopeptide (TPR) repeat protein
MKRLNIKLAVSLVVGFIVVAVSVHVLHGVQTERNAGGLLNEAREAYETKDYKKAMEMASRYLNHRREEPSGQKLLAEAAHARATLPEATLRHKRDAFRAMEHAVRVSPEDYELRRTLLQYLYDNHVYRDAVDHALLLQAAGHGDADVDLIIAKSYSAMGEYDKAVTACEKMTGYDVAAREFDSAKATAAAKVEAYALLANLLDQKSGDEEAAKLVIEQLVAVNDQSHEAQLAAFNFWRQKGKIDEARAALDKAYAISPEAADVLVNRFDMAIFDKELDKAEQLAKAGVQKYPKDPRMYLGLARIAVLRNKVPEAKKVIEQGIDQLPEDEMLLAQLFDFQIQLQDLKGAKTTLDTLRQTGFVQPLMEMFEGQVLMAELKYSAAIRKLEQARTKLQQFPPYLSRLETLLARCYEAVGEHPKAITLYEAISSRDSAVSGRLGLASANLRAGKIEEAAALLESLASQLGDKVIEVPEVWGQLIHVRALQQLKLDPSKRNWSKIDSLVVKLKESGKLTEPGKMLLDAEILQRKNDLAAARNMLFAASKRFPTEPQVWARLLHLEAQVKGPEQALELFSNVPQEIRDSLSLKLVRVNVVGRIPGEKAKEALVSMESDIDALKGDEKSALRLALVQEHRRRGDTADAKRLLEQVLSDRKDDHVSRWMYFDIVRDEFDVDGMQRMADDFRQIRGPSSEQAKLADAATKVVAVIRDHREELTPEQSEVKLTEPDKARLAEARKILEELTQSAERWHEPHKYLADIEALEGNRDAEITQLQSAMSKGQLDGNRVRRLYELLFAAQRFPEAEKLQPLLANVKGVGLEKAHIEVLLKTKRIDEAKQALERMKPAENAAVDEHLWYAYAQKSIGNLDAAASSLRSALQADPKMVDAWVMLVGVLMSQNKKNDATTVIEEAKLRVPADQRDLIVAQCYEVVNDKKRAEQYYLTASKSKPDDLMTNKMVAGYYLRLGNFEKGKQYLDTITREAAKAQSNEDKEIVAWSRRARAVVLAMNGYWEQFQEADKLLREQDISQATDDDLLLRIGLMANRKEPASMRSALQLFEELQSRKPLQPNEQVAMARLYERTGQWPQAQNAMVAALQQRDVDPLYFLVYAEMLIRNGDVNEVERWLDQYDRAKKDGVSQALRATVLAKQERPREAAELLLKTVGPLPAKPERRQQIKNTATLMETLELHEHAEKMYRELARLDRNERKELARYIGMQGKIDEAFAILDELSKEMPPLDVVTIGMNIMRARRGDLKEQHFAMLGRWYNSARQSDPNSLQIEMLVGDIWEVRGQLAKAEEVYRRVINRPDVQGPLRAMVANNLAFILSAQQKDLDEALSLINQSMGVLGPSSDLIDTRGVVYLAMNKPQEAIADFKEAILQPTASKWVHLALAQHAAGDSEAARESLRKAQDMNLKRHDLYSSEHERYDRMVQELGPLTASTTEPDLVN